MYNGADGSEAKKLLNRRQMLLKFLSGKSTEKRKKFAKEPSQNVQLFSTSLESVCQSQVAKLF